MADLGQATATSRLSATDDFADDSAEVPAAQAKATNIGQPRQLSPSYGYASLIFQLELSLVSYKERCVA